MKLSVILPCFNGATTLAVQLEALTHQHWPGGWEVIAVDNGSTDGSPAIVEHYRGRLPDLQIVQAYTPGKPRLGVPHSYNTGIKAATGDAFVFCEADDEVAPGWLEAMGHALSEHPFVVGRLEHRKLNPPWLHPPYGDGFQYAGIFRNRTAPYFMSASAAAFGIRRTFYMNVGPLSVDYPIAHDSEYCWRAQTLGHVPHFEPRAMVHYREKSRMKDRFVQGRNWGRDSTRLQQQYAKVTGRRPLLRQAAFVLRLLPVGLGAAAMASTGGLKARQRLADWVWNFGWAVGKTQALVPQAQPRFEAAVTHTRPAK